MRFLSPASAWFALLGLVILALYILKKQYLNTTVPSNLLWRRVLREQEANSPWQRLRGRLLLILQLLALLFLVIALMQPVITGKENREGHAVLLVDRSGSMSALFAANVNGGGESNKVPRLAEALQEAERWLAEQPAGRPVSLVVNGPQPRVLLSRETNHSAVSETLAGIIPVYGYSDNAAALSLADSLHQEGEEGLTVLFTDGEWHDFSESNALALHAPTKISYFGNELNNAGIVSFGMKEDGGSGLNRAIVSIRNDGNMPVDTAVAIYVYRSGEERELATELRMKVPAGEWQSAEARGLPAGDYYKAELKSGDDIAADNFAYAFPAVRESSKALFVTEGNLFLEKALLLAGVEPVKISPETAPPSGAQADQIGWVLLDGTWDKVKEQSEWMDLLSEKPIWMIDHPSQDAEGTGRPSGTEAIMEEHPVTEYLTFQDTHIGRFAVPARQEVLWGSPVVTYGGIPAIYAGTEAGKPQLRFTFRLQDSDLPLRPEFPLLILQAAAWMEGGTGQLGHSVAGEALELSLHADAADAEWSVVESWQTGFDAANDYLITPQPLTVQGSGLYETPLLPGLYRLTETSADDVVLQERYLAVSAYQGEWIPPKSENVLQLSGSAESEESLGDNGALGRDESLNDWTLTAVIAGLLLILLGLEWEVYRRGHTG